MHRIKCLLLKILRHERFSNNGHLFQGIVIYHTAVSFMTFPYFSLLRWAKGVVCQSVKLLHENRAVTLRVLGIGLNFLVICVYVVTYNVYLYIIGTKLLYMSIRMSDVHINILKHKWCVLLYIPEISNFLIERWTCKNSLTLLKYFTYWCVDSRYIRRSVTTHLWAGGLEKVSLYAKTTTKRSTLRQYHFEKVASLLYKNVCRRGFTIMIKLPNESVV